MSEETETKIGESIGLQQTYKPYSVTAKEWLQKWDNKQSVWSLEMGGLGPGYEQCIQILVAEILRDYIDVDIPANLDSFGEGAIKRCAKGVGGFSGAQVGAAQWLAMKYLKIGPEALFKVSKEKAEDRMIQVSKDWPRSPNPAGAA